jgi:hypothetical protein
VKKHLPVVMQLKDGRSKAFECLHAALDWMEEQEMPRCDSVLAVSLPSDVKELLRDGPGPMSTEARSIICKALGVRWVKSKRGRGAVTKFAVRPPRKARTA